MRKRALFALAALLLGLPAFSQERTKLARIGVLSAATAASYTERSKSFSAGLRELGYVEGKNTVIDARFADGNLEKLPALARELIARKPDVLVVSTTPAVLATKAATQTIPIVFVGVADPVSVGIVSNLRRPGANITGITNINAELTGKRLALLKEIVPAASRIALLVNPEDPNATIQIRNASTAGRNLGVDVSPVLIVRGANDLEKAFETAARSGAGAALRLVDPTTTMLRSETAQLAARHRMPVMYPFRENVEAGGLAGYGANLNEQYRQAATFVDKILRGAKAGDLPVEQPTKFELVINLRTAKALGLTIPRALLLQADQVIE